MTNPTPSSFARPKSKLTSRQMALLPPLGCGPSMRTFLPGHDESIKLPSLAVGTVGGGSDVDEGEGSNEVAMRSQRSPTAGRSSRKGVRVPVGVDELEWADVESARGDFLMAIAGGEVEEANMD